MDNWTLLVLFTGLQGQVYMYYSLTNFYQNHRRYVKSRDDNQLLGDAIPYNSLTSDCDPFRGVANESLPGGGLSYAPCGAIANSLFNGASSYCLTLFVFLFTADDSVHVSFSFVVI